MTGLGGEVPTGADLFAVGRFSEALNEYDAVGDECHGGILLSEDGPRATVPTPKAIYGACNRAAAKLELEMYRSCLRDCDDAILLDPFCLRAFILKGQAFQRLGKPARAREAYEAGVSAGREAGDVVLFAQLVDALKQGTPAEHPEAATASASQGATHSSSSSSSVPGQAIGRSDTSRGVNASEQLSAAALGGPDDTPPASPGPAGTSAGSGCIAPEGGITSSAASSPGLADGASVGEVDEISAEGGEGSADEGGCNDDGSTGTASAAHTGGGDGGLGGAKKKKKKKKNRGKRNKTGRTTWAGEEDESGRRLTLRADNDSGGVVVEGLPGVLAASDISPLLLEAARGQLCHAVGIRDIDNLIALGYLQVNTGNYRKAVELFRGLLSIRPGLVGAHLGLGSALALLGGMEGAVASFSAAIEANPLEPDCWKRRGQTRAAMGHATGALGDLDKAVELSNGRDPDVLHQRAMVYHKLRYFNRAVLDFDEVVKSKVDSKVDWNMIGLCRAQLGEPSAAAEAYRHALAVDPSFKEALTNLGSLLRDWGKGKEALVVFDNALEVDTAYVHAYHLRGLCKHGMGDHRGAQADFMRGLSYDGQDEHCRYMAALCMHATGQLEEAVRRYDALLSLKPGHQAWYTRECCVYLWSNIRRPWREFSPDEELDPEFKEGWCKRHDPMTLKRYTRHRKPTGPEARVTLADVRAPPAESAAVGGGDALTALAATFAQPAVVEAVLRAARPIGPGIQLRCPGFLPNARQHRMFGLASLEVAQLARAHWDSIESGGSGAIVSNAGSSAWRPPPGRRGKVASAEPWGHPIGYRDVFDVAVRWRQLSEPNDPVWWIDRLTPEAFREGFGLQTPMVNGQLKVVRYYPYYPMALELMKELMCKQSVLEDDAKDAIRRPDAGLAELHAAVGHDHWVVTPCVRKSLGESNEGRVMEGTRLTIVAHPPEGFEFTIRTPGTPGRWLQYDAELCAVWGKLTAAVGEEARPHDDDEREGEEGKDSRREAVCDAILELFYYWVNFGPLSRGSAACGYIVLSGLMAAAGWRLTEPLPTDVQMDWEAILRPTPEDFIAKVRPWLMRSRRREDTLVGVPSVSSALHTALEAIKALNGP